MKRLVLLLLLCALSIDSYSQDSHFRHGLESVGLHAGTWFPLNSNNVLGNSLLLGLTSNFRKNSNTLNICMDVWGGGKMHSFLALPVNDTLIEMKKYLCQQFIIAYGRDLLKRDKLLVDVQAGVGYGDITYRKDKHNEANKGYLILSPSISIRYRVFDLYCLKLVAGYSFADLGINSHSGLKGNYIVTRLIVGAL